MEQIEYPIRINRYLYLKNVCSRRQADRFVEEGKVFINGKKAVLGQKVHEGDSVDLTGNAKRARNSYVYYAFNKPKGIVTHNPQRDEQGIEDIFEPASFSRPQGVRVFPVGRLDKNSHGLVFLTNDGRVVDKMLNPKFYHEKEYVVRVNKNLTEGFKKKMERGVNIEGYVTKPAKVTLLDQRRFKIILTEGKKHQIRRMCTALGYEVRALKRVRMMSITLGGIKEGEGRKIKKEDARRLLGSLGIN